MKLYSVWHSRDDEDGHTAMVFGFLRRADPQLGLDHWLTETFERTINAHALEPEDFWPSVPATDPGLIDEKHPVHGGCRPVSEDPDDPTR